MDCAVFVVCSDKTTSTTNTMSAEYDNTKEATVRYTDGSMYTGQLTRDGKRSGTGICRYLMIMYGEVTGNPDTLLHWMEYTGEWENDEPSVGQLTHVRGDGRRIVKFTGSWKHGEPFETHFSDRFENLAC
jgi:hypothetical protein